LALQRPQLAGELIPEIETAAQRAAELCRQMLAYAGKTQFFMKSLNVSALLNDMLKMLKSTISQNVVIKPLLGTDIPVIKADAAQIRQVIMNLIINAAEAIGEAQGEVCVSLTKTEIRPEQPEKDHLGKIIPPDWYICLEVTDNGCGMDDVTKKRIFEPFYSTKFTGRGLGMSENLGIITAHKGAMQISSHPGHGSSFKIYLPVLTSDTAREALLQQAAPSAWQGSGTILLVEDEPQLMTVAKNLMKALGFMVFEATNGREALEQYRKNAEYINLVVTDVGMPIMDGYELFRELKKITPELPIIVSSGFGDVDVTSKITGGEIAGLLSKPYRFDQLRDVLKSVVEGAKPTP
jgi:CheY-like chemotaxis protein